MQRNTYKITLSVLSKAPQNISKECTMSNKVVKPSGLGIDLKELERVVKSKFPYLSFVKIIDSKLESDRFRENVVLTVKSRKLPNDLSLVGLNPAYQTWEVNVT